MIKSLKDINSNINSNSPSTYFRPHSSYGTVARGITGPTHTLNSYERTGSDGIALDDTGREESNIIFI